jgi:hypothetical protein
MRPGQVVLVPDPHQPSIGGRLPHCLITMQRSKKSYGYFADIRF